MKRSKRTENPHEPSSHPDLSDVATSAEQNPVPPGQQLECGAKKAHPPPVLPKPLSRKRHQARTDESPIPSVQRMLQRAEPSLQQYHQRSATQRESWKGRGEPQEARSHSKDMLQPRLQPTVEGAHTSEQNPARPQKDRTRHRHQPKMQQRQQGEPFAKERRQPVQIVDMRLPKGRAKTQSRQGFDNFKDLGSPRATAAQQRPTTTHSRNRAGLQRHKKRPPSTQKPCCFRCCWCYRKRRSAHTGDGDFERKNLSKNADAEDEESDEDESEDEEEETEEKEVKEEAPKEKAEEKEEKKDEAAAEEEEEEDEESDADENKACSLFRRLLAFFFSSVGLIVLVAAYCIMGGFLFQYLENTGEKEQRTRVEVYRKWSILNLWNVTMELNVLHEGNWTRAAEKIFLDYQDFIYNAVSSGGWDGRASGAKGYQWSFMGSLLFSTTVITTIGYGNVAPKTPMGRFVTIIYALFGIPLCLTCLSFIGDAFATFFRYIWNKVSYRFIKVFGMDYDEEKFKDSCENRVPLTVSLAIITGYLLIGALIFSTWEKDWNYLVGAYFCFITLSTIGFGDYVFGTNTEQDSLQKTLLCTFYLVLGLSLLSMCFTLMQEEVVSKAKHVSARCKQCLKRKPKEEPEV